MHLVDQHYQNEFLPHLGHAAKIVPISGDSREKDFVGRVVKDSNLVICTAQILENALINKEEDKHVELTGEYNNASQTELCKSLKYLRNLYLNSVYY